jgi:hypothetical protein
MNMTDGPVGEYLCRQDAVLAAEFSVHTLAEAAQDFICRYHWVTTIRWDMDSVIASLVVVNRGGT